MSTTIDNKVVKMTFDNKDFEKNAQTSINTIASLQKNLNLTGATKGLEEVDKAAKKLDLSPASKSVDSLKVSFSALEVVAITAISKITSRAMDMASSLSNALTVQPIFTGFSEYETQIGAIQTILANTSKEGTTLTQVNRALDELNTYADKTIYNFTEMTRNIGTFTAAGVELNTSVDAIKGIANLAAVSGSTSAQASTAMYQLSQALAAGRVSLMDWNSVVNAGMGGMVFQEALKETSRVMGTGVDAALEEYGSFRDSLTSGGWLTTEVLTQTLKQFTGDMSEAQLAELGYTTDQIAEIIAMGERANAAATEVKTLSQLFDTLKEAAQSGWSQTWRIIVGDFEEAKELFTEISDVIGGMIGASADARNDVLTEGLSTTWKKFLDQGVIDEDLLMSGIADVAAETIDDYDELIAKHGSFQKALSTGFLTEDMLLGGIQKAQEHLNTFTDQQLTDELGYSAEQIETWRELVTSIEDGSFALSGWVDEMDKVSGRQKLVNSLMNTFNAVMKILTPIQNAFKEIFTPVTGEQIYSFADGLESFTKSLIITDETASAIQETFKGLFSIFKIFTDSISFVGKSIIGIFGGGIQAIMPLLTGFATVIGTISGSVADWINTNISLEATFNFIKSTIEKTLEPISKWSSELISLEDVMAFFGARGQEILNLFSFFGTNLQNSMGALSEFGISTEGVSKALSGVIQAFKDLFSGIGGVGGEVNILDAIGKSIGNLGTAVKEFLVNSGENITEGLVNIVGGIAGAFDWLVQFVQDALFKIYGNTGDFLSLLSSISTLFFLEKIVDLLKVVAAPLEAISKVLESFSGILDGVEKVMDTFVGTLKKFNGVLTAMKWKTYAEAMKSFAIGVLILAGALWIVSKIDPDRLLDSVLAIGALAVILAGLAWATSKVSDTKALAGLAVVLIAFGAALWIISDAIVRFANAEVGFWSFVGFLIMMGAFIGIIAVALKTMKNLDKDLVRLGIAMILIAIAVRVLTESIIMLSNATIGSIIQGLIILVVTLVGLAVVASLYSGTLAKAGGSILAISIALLVFTYALKQLSAMESDTLNKAIPALTIMVLSLIGISISIRLAGRAYRGIGVEILAIAAAFILLGYAMKVMGSIKQNELSTAIMSITMISLVIIALMTTMAVMNKLGGGGGKNIAGIGLAMIGIAIAFSAIAFAIWMLGMLDEAVLQRCTNAIFMIGIMFAVLLKSIGSYDNVYRTVLGLAVIIVVLVASMYALTLLSYDLVVESVKKMAMILGLLAIVLYAAKFVGDSGKTMLFLAITIGLLVGSLMLLTLFSPDAVLENAKAMGVVMIAMAAIMTTLKNINVDIKQAFMALVTMTAMMLVITGIFYLMQNLNPESTLKLAIALSLVMTAMAAAIGVMSLVGPMASAALPGLAGVSAILLVLMGIFIALGHFYQQNETFREAVHGAVDLLIILAEGLGLAIAAFGAGVVSTLPDIASSLSMFMTMLQPFIWYLGAIDPGIITGAGALAGAIVALSAASFISGIAAFISAGDGFDGFEKNIKQLAAGLRVFDEETSSIKNVYRISEMAEAMSDLVEAVSGVDTEGGLKGLIFGSSDIESFGEGVKSMAKMLEEISASDYEINKGQISTIADSITILNDAISEIEKSGGLMGDIFGEIDVDKFKNDIILLKGVLRLLSSDDYIVDIEKIDQFKQGILAMTDAYSTLGKTGGALEFVMGEVDIDKINSDFNALTGLLFGISQFMATENAINIDSISQYKLAIQTLIDTYAYLSTLQSDNIGDAVNNLFAENDVRTLVGGVEELVSILLDSVGNEIDYISLNEMGASISTAIADGITGEGPMASMGRAAETIFWAFANVFSLNDEEGFQFALNLAALNFVKGFADGVDLYAHIAAEASARMAQGAIDAVNTTLDINSPSKVLFKSGNWSGVGFVNGFMNQYKNAGKAGDSIATNAIDSLQNTLSRLQNNISDEIDTSLVIRPVIDASEVNKGVSSINARLSSIKADEIGTSINTNTKSSTTTSPDGTTNSQGSTQINYNQTITSPKAISRTEIYRHSNNLLARSKGVATT